MAKSSTSTTSPAPSPTAANHLTLHDLAIVVLACQLQPISRVRFAKTIYFVHKHLVRHHLMNADAIKYLRLPLGPVPQGFADLVRPHSGIVTQKNPNINLFYEIEEYLLTDQAKTKLSDAQIAIRSSVEKTLSLLQPHSTTALVEASRDPSWLAHANGEVYQITPVDLKNLFPYPQVQLKLHLKSRNANEIGALQANLLRGMLSDIVKESTDLEYPDSTSNLVQARPKPLSPAFLRHLLELLTKTDPKKPQE